MIKVDSCQRLNIPKSKTSRLQNPTQMTKIGIFHQLMPRTWQIVTAEGLDGVAEDKFSTITQSTSEGSIYKSEMSRLQKLTQIIKIGIFHRLIPRTWWIVNQKVSVLAGQSFTSCTNHIFPTVLHMILKIQTKI